MPDAVRVAGSAGRAGLGRPIVAGLVTALVGYTSAFAVVLAGLAAVGATPAQASAGLTAVSVTMGLATVLLAWRFRMPITVAWSTPGAALLAATGLVEGGWPAAVGAFAVTGVLILLTGLVPALGALVARIPQPVAQAMLAGVLLPLALGPIVGLAANPLAVAPVVVVWLLAARLAPRWAVPLAFVVAAVVVVVQLVASGVGIDPAAALPRLELTMPVFTIPAVVGLALPLYLVTMASQNVPGVAVMRGFGYEVPWRASMLVTGAGTLLGAPAGAHAINLAAISAALAAGPDAGEDRDRRWVAGVTAGIGFAVLGLASAAFGVLVELAPEGVIPAVAGVALLGPLVAALAGAVAVPGARIPAAAAFVTAASGVSVAGVSAAFWALVVGMVVSVVLRPGTRA